MGIFSSLQVGTAVPMAKRLGKWRDPLLDISWIAAAFVGAVAIVMGLVGIVLGGWGYVYLVALGAAFVLWGAAAHRAG